MTATRKTMTRKPDREQFEELIEYAPAIFGFRLHNEMECAEVFQSIQEHKYLINMKIPYEISLEQAIFSWYENIYHPVAQAMDESSLFSSFPGASRIELFLQVTRHWHHLKKESGREISAEAAVSHFGAQFATGFFSRFLYKLKKLFA